MNADDLKHAFTTPELERVNLSLAQLLNDTSSTEPSHFERINELTQLRESIVKELLSTLDDENRKQFAQEEYKVNQKLSEVAQSLLSSTKDDMVRFVRSQKAVKKYK